MGCSSSAAAGGPRAKPTVTITGISGYLGSHVCKLYLESDKYKVRGTVRNKDDEAKMADLKEAFGEALFAKLELRNADLMNAESLMSAIEGSDYVVHVASPFFFSGDRDSLVGPAVNGTTAVMKACQASKVKRCVVTSSCVSIAFCAVEDRPADNIYNESHWSNPDAEPCQNAYFASKTLAEKAAWDFVEKLPVEEKFELVTICPSFIMGPPLKKNESGTSVGFMKSVLLGQREALSADTMQSVDVRDAALAHLLALQKKEAAGQRYILSQGEPTWQEYAKPVADKYKPLGWPVSDNEVEASEEFHPKFDNSKAKKLGVKFTAWDKTVVDMADAMVASGAVVKPESS
mmetsp:Transcript_42555/g.56161  ORF Transcript_42555/g.56161 Transcript_42555/m.56161 type:complete len:347 (+) Transcript_42555:23-1063(+)|eukprot:CAMPEP_0185580262 /NCGR_PEP_ID=MMETSP0434-20130131/15902_1 /TAXON_ID=626734 ORGANISM="Favella taraikaensis, Strain Fe Narragansett Bay" /NCGR_SAMPLE_ID=MMETSP0434 /ASSEMBLY_ACC=CAM_ASM_000379 /LENGTH=346 /DNA_ID=CAMNT_0028198477 /DNA_START=23 /DNA_END=1063 /DNA_ORIENTATION=+